GGNDDLREADIVVGEERNFQPSGNDGIVVDYFCDVVDQLDDQLGVAVTRRGLASEYFHSRHPVALRLVLDRVIESYGFEDIKQLPLVFVDALDLDVEQRAGIDHKSEAFPNQPRQGDFVVVSDRPELLLEGVIAGSG